MTEQYDLVPRPSAHIKTLSRIGYTFVSAIGDLVDNCIAANAKNVWIDFYPNNGEIELTIRDDGCGMDKSSLIENMRLSCKDPSDERENGDLGRFGSGMKTASFSQCRKLIVVSKNNNPHTIASWDLDLIERVNEWTLLVSDDIKKISFHDYEMFDEQSHGTTVVWRNFPRYYSLDMAEKEKMLGQDNANLKTYLSLYFHKFLSTNKNRINIFLNNQKITPVDPFLSGLPGYQEFPTEKFRIRKGGSITITPHILPHESKLSDEQLDTLGGIDNITAKQGIYIYRANRLIVEGGWHGLAKLSLLGRLARIEVNVPTTLDEEWSTDVKKSSLIIPEKVKEKLRRLSFTPQEKSKRAYTYRGKLNETNSFWNIRTNSRNGMISYEFNAKNEVLISLLNCMESNDQKEAILKYLELLVKELPLDSIFEKVASKSVDQTEVDFDKLYEELMHGR